MYAVLCGMSFFWTIEHFNLLPRLFLGILLFFAGAGFVCENLWGSRKYLSVREWGQILFILTVFIFSGDMLYAVLFGVILTCTVFILTYAKVPCVAEKPAKGSVPSCVRREPLLQNSLRHITDAWMLVVNLKGFVFFASAQAVVAQLREVLDAQEKVPVYLRLRFLVFDCQLVDGMDASTAKTLRKLTGDAKKMKISMLYTHATGDLKERLMAQELADENKIFQTLDDALSCIEERAIRYLTGILKLVRKAREERSALSG